MNCFKITAPRTVIIVALIAVAAHNSDAFSRNKRAPPLETEEVIPQVTCSKAADIVLAIDESNSISTLGQWYKDMLHFAVNIVLGFQVAPDATRFGVLKFNEKVHKVFYLNKYRDAASVLQAVSSLRRAGGLTNIAAALRAARNEMFVPENGARPSVPKILLLITDGKAVVEHLSTMEEAKKTKEAGIQIFTVGITPNINKQELQNICSQPAHAHFFYVDNFSGLHKLIGSVKTKICENSASIDWSSLTPALPWCDDIITGMPKCSGSADIVLALDESGSITYHGGMSNWYVDLLGFVRSLMLAFPISPTLTQFGVLKFNESTTVQFHLNTYRTKREILYATSNMKHSEGKTNIAAALRTARNDLFSSAHGARPSVPKILILITDGKPTEEKASTVPEADRTKAAGIKIFTIGITNDVNKKQLEGISSQPHRSHYFFVKDFKSLSSVLESLVKSSCKEAAHVTPECHPRTPAVSSTEDCTDRTPVRCNEAKNWECYYKPLRKDCCQTCRKHSRNIPGCEYGDRADWCPEMENELCQRKHEMKICCETCLQQRK